jgi:taurine dioxygenase
MSAHLELNRVNPWVAEVHDFDCRDEIAVSNSLVGLRAAFRDNHILVFRHQRLTPSELVQFSLNFGELERPVNDKYTHPDDASVLILSNEINPDGSAVGVVDAGTDWHSDSSHEKHPAKATILQSIIKPKTGGDTLYCNMHAVYASLPEDVRSAIDGKMGVHALSKLGNRRVEISQNRPGAVEDYQSFEQQRESVLQPLVRTHPETGARSLYASPRFTVGIDGLEDDAAQPLLDTLFSYMAREEHHYRHVWNEKDLVMWDNRCLNHKATGGVQPGDIRRMHRTVLAGDGAYFEPDAARSGNES